MSDTPLDEVLDAAIQDALGDIHVGGVGEVTSYSHSDQTATVQPVIQSRFVDADTGEPEFLQPPPIPNVPVQFPSGGGYSITWPLQSGDTVYLCFADQSHDEWQAQGGGEKQPQDPRRFDLTDAFAFPAGQSPASPVDSSGLSQNAMVVKLASQLHLGSASPGTWVARDDKVSSAMQANETAYNAHTHQYLVPLIPISPSPTIPPVAPQQSPTKPTDVRSSKVQTE